MTQYLRFLSLPVGKRRLLRFQAVWAAVVLTAAFSLPPVVYGNEKPGSATEDLTTLSIEDLMNIRITSVSKKPQKLSDSAAAVFVITQKDIKRSGATGIPEVLRMVPGLQTARIDANKWAVSSRGFNGRFANKLLVLIDGRSVYTPLFSGVFWEVQDTMLEDIERIEVIRGPGATLWGANAVNGVINIMTKHAEDTQGGLVSLGTGTEEKGFINTRFGKAVGNDTFYRIYGKYFDRDRSTDAAGASMSDNWDIIRSGFRVDHHPSDANQFTFQGDIYGGHTGQSIRLDSIVPPYSQWYHERAHVEGNNLLFRWNQAHSENSDMMLQVYYDQTRHTEIIANIHHQIFDADFHHRFFLNKRNEIIWGAGYRLTHDDIIGSTQVGLNPSSRNDNLFSAFLQDDIILMENYLRLILGSKFEHNDYTGYEIQPSGRLLWTPDEHYGFWAGVSRAVRTPSRVEHDGKLIGTVTPPFTSPNTSSLPYASFLLGNKAYKSEDLTAYEVGFRMKRADDFSIDAAVFYNEYDDLRTIAYSNNAVIRTSPSPVHLFLPVYAENRMKGETYGIEIAADWRVHDRLRLLPAYTFLKTTLHHYGDTRDGMYENAEKESPQNQVSLRALTDLPRRLELDLWGRYVDSLPAHGIDDYFSLSARLGWKPVKHIEWEIVGKNLLDAGHAEYVPELLTVSHTEVERSVYIKMTWRF